MIADFIIRDLNLQNIKKLSPPLVTLPGYCFINKKNQHLISGIAKALSEMKTDGSFKSIKDIVMKKKVIN